MADFNICMCCHFWLETIMVDFRICQVIHSVAHYIITSIVQGLWLQVLLILLLCETCNDFQVMKTAHREYQRLRGAVSRDPQLSNLPGLSQYQARIYLVFALLPSFSPYQLS